VCVLVVREKNAWLLELPLLRNAHNQATSSLAWKKLFVMLMLLVPADGNTLKNTKNASQILMWMQPFAAHVIRANVLPMTIVSGVSLVTVLLTSAPLVREDVYLFLS
jgi:hypothetical protein